MGARKHSFVGIGFALAITTPSGFARAQAPLTPDANQSPPSVAPAPAPTPPPLPTRLVPPPLPTEAQFFYDVGGKPVGPVDLAGLQAKVTAGAIGPATLVWKSGAPGWVDARNLSDLASNFQSAPPLPKPNPEIARPVAAMGPVAAIPLVRQWVQFTDPREQAFSLEMPEGWRNIGGTNRFNGLQFRNWASTASPDGETSIALNDPREPSYIAFSRLLAAAGFHIGDRYNGGGDTVYIVTGANLRA